MIGIFLCRIYYDAARNVSFELGVETLDFWDALDNTEMFIDGLHFSKKGNAEFFKKLWPLIEKRTMALPKMFPDPAILDSSKFLSRN